MLGTDSRDGETTLSLLYTRLACLVLISRPDLAAEEALPLTEFLSRNSPVAREVLAIVPWELRLLLIRLQPIVAADGGRRAVMALYSLSGEVRTQVAEARTTNDEAALDLWCSRLRDLAMRVADSFVEMGELETAYRHLDALTDADPDEIHYRKAFLRLRIGGTADAATSAQAIQSSERREVLEALLQTADGDWDAAMRAWQDLAAKRFDDKLLYTGYLVGARAVLEDLAKNSPAFPTLLFNLSTVYELCTERAIVRKSQAAQMLASKTPHAASGGWERTNAELKL
jgi:hypothetical protein